jgi:hypothetical protein
MSGEVVRIRDLLSKVLEVGDTSLNLTSTHSHFKNEMRPLKAAGILWSHADPLKLHPYAAQARMRDLRGDQKWAYSALSRVSSLARAMGYLVCTTCLVHHKTLTSPLD